MFYVKNVPLFERVLRALFGIVLAAAAIFVYIQSSLGAFSWLIALVVFVTGVFAVATGFFGWCPACAMFGRKLKMNQRAH